MAYILIYHDTVEPLLNNSLDTLPEPGEEAKSRSHQVMQCLRDVCHAAGGWIPFSQYMEIALYQPGIGYYTGGLQKFGAKGDFITAPEVSPLFGQCLAKQISEILQGLNNQASVLEFGAGSGILAVDILLELERLNVLPEQYLIVELSAELRLRQQEKIKQDAPHLFSRVQWLSELVTDLGDVVVIANEVLDAMPIECFKIKDDKTQLLMVGFENDVLVSRYSDSSVTSIIENIEQRSEFEFSTEYCSEYNPAIKAWLALLAENVESCVVLLIDYGYNETEYYHADRVSGTQMCYYQHRAHNDYLWWPGLQDITAFVNFTDVAYNAVDLQMEVSGYTTQAAFLLACGLSELHAEQVNNDVKQQIKLSQQIKTLTLPSEMGDRFKVMALTKNYDKPLLGFSMLDLRNRL